MLNTCRDVVKLALRKLNRIAAGTEPDGNDLVDAMEVLQDLYLELAGTGIFGRMYDVVVTDATFNALPQMRILCDNEDGCAVTLPDLIDPTAWAQYTGLAGWPFCDCDEYFRIFDYGFTGVGISRSMPPPDASCIQIGDVFSPTFQTYVYEAASTHSQKWIQLESLNPGDIAPLAHRYKNGIVSILAERLGPEYGVPVAPEISSAASRALYNLNHRYDGRRAPVKAEYF